ncbi:MaoC dehydratase-like protein [Williamsia limnetica]|uniref:MaoC dehydratase-like protein n=1 Tax=Williamsia limnetica TaxID=882452 RepID=A0A318RBB8_WILLI|nr:MaoC/PaaZ C-terminal domain-containing protein [Williamsia limnetica]PYE12337.1 MaoC dehydratase-like protein [Williamsia limnetica]
MTRRPVDLEVGQSLDPRTVGPITQTDIVRFAGAGGDFNPLHHDGAYARESGLPGVISMGQMQAGMLAAWVSDLFHVEHVLAFSVRFAAPLLIGDILVLSGTVDNIVGAGPEAVADLALSGARADQAIITGRARVRITTASRA